MRKPVDRRGIVVSCAKHAGEAVVAAVSAFPTAPHTDLRSEHCLAGADVLSRLGAPEGRQVRLNVGEAKALYTLRLAQFDSANTVFLSPGGVRRLGVGSLSKAHLSLECARSNVTPEAARLAGELVESTDYAGGHTQYLAIAPHGGDIERRTDLQAQRVAELLSADRAKYWICQGWRPGWSAYDAWHISSNDLNVDSFPVLRTLARRRYRRVVAFHGFADNAVVVGGAAPRPLTHDIRTAIAEALEGQDIPVEVADANTRYGGQLESNLVNRLSDGGAGGIQIEQGLIARDRFWRKIADAVAAVLANDSEK